MFLQLTEIQLIEEKDHHYEWKGHGPLSAKEGSITVQRGFVPQLALQLNPAAPVTALTTYSDWGLYVTLEFCLVCFCFERD